MWQSCKVLMISKLGPFHSVAQKAILEGYKE